MGAVHGSDPDPRSWAEKRQAEEEALGYTTQPYALVVGGGQGGILGGQAETTLPGQHSALPG